MTNQVTPNILSFKPFAFHKDFGRSKFDNAKVRSTPRGFTAWISSSDKPRIINVQIAHCAYKDEFCKKTGRETAQQMPVLEINPRELPCILADAYLYCLPEKEQKFFKNDQRGVSRKFEFLWKYML